MMCRCGSLLATNPFTLLYNAVALCHMLNNGRWEREEMANGGMRLVRVAQKFFFCHVLLLCRLLYLLLFIQFEGFNWCCGDLLPKFRNVSHFCLNLSRRRRASWIFGETLLRAAAYLLSSLSSPAFRERPSPSYSITTVTSPSIIRRCCPPPSPEQPSTSPASRSTMWMVSSQQAPLRVSGTFFGISPLIYSRPF